MVRKMLVIAVLGVAISSFAIGGCEDKLDKGFEKGFTEGRGDIGNFGLFFCGAKSDTIYFDPDNVSIDFYFGHALMLFSNVFGHTPTRITPDWDLIEGYERVSIASVFFRGDNDAVGNYLSSEHAYYLYLICIIILY